MPSNPIKKFFVIKRTVAFLILITFISTHPFSTSSFAVAPRLTVGGVIHELPLQLSSLVVPAEIGKIQEVYSSAGRQSTAPVVVLIQDAHAIPEAQRNIQKLIEYFQNEYGISNVAVEGAAAELDPQIFRSFPDPEALQKTFEEYLEQGELTGPAAAAIFSKNPGHYRGIEDWALYEQGYGLYLQAMKNAAHFEPWIGSWKSDLAKRKHETYSKKLLAIDQALEKFHENHSDLLKVVRVLMNVGAQLIAPSKGVMNHAPTSLRALLQESDSPEIEKEVKKIAEQVKKYVGAQLIASSRGVINHAPTVDSRSFNQKYQAFQTSQITPQAFALFLKELSAKNNIPLKISEELLSAVKNQKRLKDIEGTNFFKDFEAYVQLVKESLFRNEEEKKLDQENSQLYLATKLAKLELSREEWNEVEKWERQPFNLSTHFAFYRNAEKRDGVFFKNLLQLLSTKRSPLHAALFVAGGFHMQGLIQKFKEKGIAYVLITPQINSIPENTRYRELMNGNISWKNYFKAENGKVDLYKAFVRAARDNLLKDPCVLKPWRDKIIVDLANQREIENAGQYTQFLDEVPAAVTSKPEWQIKIEKLIEGLRRLDARGQFTQPNILRLLQPSTMLQLKAGNTSIAPGSFYSAATGSAASMSNTIRNLPSIDLHPVAPFRRSEVRAKKQQHILQNFLGQKIEKLIATLKGPGRKNAIKELLGLKQSIIFQLDDALARSRRPIQKDDELLGLLRKISDTGVPELRSEVRSEEGKFIPTRTFPETFFDHYTNNNIPTGRTLAEGYEESIDDYTGGTMRIPQVKLVVDEPVYDEYGDLIRTDRKYVDMIQAERQKQEPVKEVLPFHPQRYGWETIYEDDGEGGLTPVSVEVAYGYVEEHDEYGDIEHIPTIKKVIRRTESDGEGGTIEVIDYENFGPRSEVRNVFQILGNIGKQLGLRALFANSNQTLFLSGFMATASFIVNPRQRTSNQSYKPALKKQRYDKSGRHDAVRYNNTHHRRNKHHRRSEVRAEEKKEIPKNLREMTLQVQFPNEPIYPQGRFSNETTYGFYLAPLPKLSGEDMQRLDAAFGSRLPGGDYFLFADKNQKPLGMGKSLVVKNADFEKRFKGNQELIALHRRTVEANRKSENTQIIELMPGPASWNLPIGAVGMAVTGMETMDLSVHRIFIPKDIHETGIEDIRIQPVRPENGIYKAHFIFRRSEVRAQEKTAGAQSIEFPIFNSREEAVDSSEIKISPLKDGNGRIVGTRIQSGEHIEKIQDWQKLEEVLNALFQTSNAPVTSLSPKAGSFTEFLILTRVSEKPFVVDYLKPTSLVRVLQAIHDFAERPFLTAPRSEVRKEFNSLLVAEDEPAIRQMILFAIRQYYPNIQVDTATNGQKALEKFQTKNYDAVLSDLAMPVMNGAELAEAIHSVNSNAVVAIWSGKQALPENQALVKPLIEGKKIIGFFPKPSGAKDLLDLLNAEVSKRSEVRTGWSSLQSIDRILGDGASSRILTIELKRLEEGAVKAEYAALEKDLRDFVGKKAADVLSFEPLVSAILFHHQYHPSTEDLEEVNRVAEWIVSQFPGYKIVMTTMYVVDSSNSGLNSAYQTQIRIGEPGDSTEKLLDIFVHYRPNDLRPYRIDAWSDKIVPSFSEKGATALADGIEGDVGETHRQNFLPSAKRLLDQLRKKKNLSIWFRWNLDNQAKIISYRSTSASDLQWTYRIEILAPTTLGELFKLLRKSQNEKRYSNGASFVSSKRPAEEVNSLIERYRDEMHLLPLQIEDVVDLDFAASAIAPRNFTIPANEPPSHRRSEVREIADRIVKQTRSSVRIPEFNLAEASGKFAEAGARIVVPELEAAEVRSEQADLQQAKAGLEAIIKNINRPAAVGVELSAPVVGEMLKSGELRGLLETIAGAIGKNKFVTAPFVVTGEGLEKIGITRRVLDLLGFIQAEQKIPAGSKVVAVPSKNGLIFYRKDLLEEKPDLVLEDIPISYLIRPGFKNEDRVQIDSTQDEQGGVIARSEVRGIFAGALAAVALSKKLADQFIPRSGNPNRLSPVRSALASLGILATLLASGESVRATASAA